uniref:Cytoplasmic phosphatidylinositol transfer protein 1-like n=1 Tax=Coturnix japonica TaxID=93934 RepID=A0A8C2U2Y5_COTJA
MLVKEYRICMPLTTEEYRVGQLYTISKHSHQESEKGEGVEVVRNEPHEDPVHGPGQFTEKRVHLSSKLPSWARAVTPRIFYITEKAWNYYPYTITGESHSWLLSPQCSFLPKFSIYIETKYEDNCGDSENIFHSDKILGDHEVSFLDIAFDEIPERYYRSLEDPRFFSSAKTGRGPLREGWRQHTKPIMCSYKLVTVKFEVWGLQTRVEQFVHKVIRDILLIGHRQAFTWVDEWCGESLPFPRPQNMGLQKPPAPLVPHNPMPLHHCTPGTVLGKAWPKQHCSQTIQNSHHWGHHWGQYSSLPSRQAHGKVCAFNTHLQVATTQS